MASRKMQLVAQNLLENTGKSVSQAMREAGYSKGSWRNPQQLTRSKSWQELVQQYFPNEHVLQAHFGLLGASKIGRTNFPKSLSNPKIKVIIEQQTNYRVLSILEENNEKICFYTYPDSTQVAKGLDLLYKITAKYSATKVQLIEDPFDLMSDEELDSEISRLESIVTRYKSSHPRT